MKESKIEILRDKLLNSWEFNNQRRQFYGNQHLYNGFCQEDIQLLNKYCEKNIFPEDGYLTDFMGIKHSVSDILFIKHRNKEIVSNIPVPDDSFHAKAIEYVGTLLAVEAANDSFTMFELGAGWGPWMATSGVACKKRENINAINLVGVEGTEIKILYIKNHLAKNGLTDTYLKTNIYQGVVNTDGGKMKFPVASGDNYGESVLANTMHYRNLELIEVNGFTCSFLFADYNMIDLVHIDIQGYEEILFSDPATMEVFKGKVKFIVIGTHSRKIEGMLIELLYKNDFYLLREEPALISLPTECPDSFVDITFQDGTQVWVNKNLC
jgi:hypothetical protein